VSNQVSVESGSKKSVKGRKLLWLAVVAIITWLAIGGFSGAAFSKISTVQENDNSAFLPDSAESTIANKSIVRFSQQSADVLPTLLLLVGDLSPSANAQTFAAVNQYATTLGDKLLPETGKPLSEYFAPTPIAAIPASDGKAILINVSLDSAIAGENIDEKPVLPLIIEFIREDLEKNFGAAGLQTHVTGPGGIFADLFDAFGSIDTRLLKPLW